MCAAIQQSHAQDRPFETPQDACSSHNGVPSTSTVHHNSRTPTPPPMLPSQHPQTLPEDEVHNAGAVAHLTTAHGIKVRDFAYENKLPPVTTVPRFTVQVQPRPRPLKRTRDMFDGAGHEDGEESDEEDPSIPRTFYIDSSGTGTSHTYRYRQKAAVLERTLTEPADDRPPPSQGFNTRANFFLQPSHVLRQPSPPRWPRQGAALFPTTPNKAVSRSPFAGLSPISTIPHSQPSMVMESQESEPYLETPLVTPNGSLQWPVQNTSALPNSQLESVLPQLPDTNVTMSQLGFTPERSPRNRTSARAEGSPSRRHHRHTQLQLPPPADFNPHAPAASKSRSTSSSSTRGATRSEAASSVPLKEAPAHRYDLRQRPEGAKPAPAKAATSRGTSRTRSSKQVSTTKSEKPPSKRRKVTPPEPSTKTTRGRRKNGEVKR
ncbi:hypothetical protein LXA43DRAFT_937827 [Ganoderma leucocontextum]|nr:hypothetical protein LXA43DRAFT_937827 [Ganoderma leucocontextum]